MGQIPIHERAIEPRPQDLQDVPSRDLNRPQRLAYPLTEIVNDILREARAAGFRPPMFHVVSGYRSIKEQEGIYAKGLKKYGSAEKAAPYVAKPGTSAHHTGYCLDFFLGLPTTTENIPAIRKSKAYAFLKRVAPKYGLWELPSEPWHWELDQEARDAYIRAKESFAQLTPSAEQIEPSEVTMSFSAPETEQSVKPPKKKKAMWSTKSTLGISFAVVGLVGLGIAYKHSRDV